MSGKGRTTVTLEERIAQIDNLDHSMETKLGSELSETFRSLMSRHKKCAKCQQDCPTFRWHEYGVHTLPECEQYCKLMVCKSWADPQEQEVFEEELRKRAKNPPYAKSTAFLSYLPDYLRDYGRENVTFNDTGMYEVIWQPPREKQQYEKFDPDEFHKDPMQALRELPSVRKSTEDVLKEISRQEEAEKLVPAFETPKALEIKDIMWTRKDLDRDRKAQARSSQSSSPWRAEML